MPVPRLPRLIGGLALCLLPLTSLLPAVANAAPATLPTSTATAAPASAMTVSARTLQTGVEVFSMWRDWEMNTQMLDRIAAAGSEWVRIGVGWCSLEERGPGVVSPWYQDRLDATVAEAGRRGLKLLVTLGCTPMWAGGDTGYKVLPTETAQYRRVAEYLAGRYRGRVQAWEIWNEPDCVTGTCPEGDPAAYVPVLRAGYAGVKAGDPAATVVTGGVSGANADWIQRMYAAGARGSFDALALHPYQGPAAEPPEAPQAEHPYRIANVEKVRAVMVAQGDGAKPIWFTEFGWTTGVGTGWSAGVDEATQADYLRRAMVMVQNSYPYVTHAFWFTVRDRDDWTPYENHFGLLRLDGTPKPAYAALQAANSWLRSTAGARTVVLPAVADTVVRQQAPSTAGGGASRLLTDVDETAGSTKSRATTYLRFEVPALAAGESIRSATLRLGVTDATSDGPAVWRTSPAWDEARTTWRSGRPARSGTASVGDFGAVPVGTVHLPVRGVTSAGAVSLELDAQSRDGLSVSSREDVGAQLPQLVLDIGPSTSTLSRADGARRTPSKRRQLVVRTAHPR